MPEITVKQIEYFFAYYEDLEELKWVKVPGWGNLADAKKLSWSASIAREPTRRRPVAHAGRVRSITGPTIEK